MVRKFYIEKKIPCYFRFETGSTLEHCKNCNFFNGIVKDGDEEIGIDCLRGEIGALGAHVTQFEKGDYVYKSRKYDEEIDGELSEPYEYCEKCCFDKTLKNGHNICLLRCSDTGDDPHPFICYEGEIWIKEKIEDDENSKE